LIRHQYINEAFQREDKVRLAALPLTAIPRMLAPRGA